MQPTRNNALTDCGDIGEDFDWLWWEVSSLSSIAADLDFVESVTLDILE